VKLINRTMAFLVCALAAMSSFAKPSTPTNLNAKELTNGRIVLSWAATKPNESVRIYRNGREYRTGIYATQWEDDQTVTLSTYIYFVLACDSQGVCSEPSRSQFMIAFYGVHKLNTPVAPRPPVAAEPTAPTELVFSNDDDGVARLRWNSPSTAIKWNIYRNDKYAATVSGTDSTFEPEWHVPGDEYYVTAIYRNGQISPRSPSVTGGVAPLVDVREQLARAAEKIIALEKACE